MFPFQILTSAISVYDRITKAQGLANHLTEWVKAFQPLDADPITSYVDRELLVTLESLGERVSVLSPAISYLSRHCQGKHSTLEPIVQRARERIAVTQAYILYCIDRLASQHRTLITLSDLTSSAGVSSLPIASPLAPSSSGLDTSSSTLPSSTVSPTTYLPGLATALQTTSSTSVPSKHASQNHVFPSTLPAPPDALAFTQALAPSRSPPSLSSPPPSTFPSSQTQMTSSYTPAPIVTHPSLSHADLATRLEASLPNPFNTAPSASTSSSSLMSSPSVTMSTLNSTDLLRERESIVRRLRTLSADISDCVQATTLALSLAPLLARPFDTPQSTCHQYPSLPYSDSSHPHHSHSPPPLTTSPPVYSSLSPASLLRASSALINMIHEQGDVFSTKGSLYILTQRTDISSSFTTISPLPASLPPPPSSWSWSCVFPQTSLHVHHDISHISLTSTRPLSTSSSSSSSSPSLPFHSYHLNLTDISTIDNHSSSTYPSFTLPSVDSHSSRQLSFPISSDMTFDVLPLSSNNDSSQEHTSSPHASVPSTSPSPISTSPSSLPLMNSPPPSILSLPPLPPPPSLSPPPLAALTWLVSSTRYAFISEPTPRQSHPSIQPTISSSSTTTATSSTTATVSSSSSSSSSSTLHLKTPQMEPPSIGHIIATMSSTSPSHPLYLPSDSITSSPSLATASNLPGILRRSPCSSSDLSGILFIHHLLRLAAFERDAAYSLHSQATIALSHVLPQSALSSSSCPPTLASSFTHPINSTTLSTSSPPPSTTTTTCPNGTLFGTGYGGGDDRIHPTRRHRGQTNGMPSTSTPPLLHTTATDEELGLAFASQSPYLGTLITSIISPSISRSWSRQRMSQDQTLSEKVEQYEGYCNTGNQDDGHIETKGEKEGPKATEKQSTIQVAEVTSKPVVSVVSVLPEQTVIRPASEKTRECVSDGGGDGESGRGQEHQGRQDVSRESAPNEGVTDDLYSLGEIRDEEDHDLPLPPAVD